MYIEFHNRLGQPTRVEVTRVVVYDEHGNPVALAISYEQAGRVEQILTSNLDQADFQPMLHNMGINKTVIVRDLKLKTLPEIQFPSR